MNKLFKISTIIPIYNTEKYIPETIDCLLNQTIGFKDNIQIILVDDASTDHSGRLCEKYKALYPENIEYIKLDENKGVSAARNTGLKYAVGKYVNFLDSDDKWSLNAYQRMLDFLEEHSDEIDVVSSDVWYFEAREEAHALNQYHEKDCMIDIHRDYKSIRSLGSNCVVKREIAEKFPFNEQQKCWEDSVFINTVILNKEKYGMLAGDVKFYYRVRADQNSASNLLYNKTKRYYLEDLTYFFDGIHEQSMKYCGFFAPMCQYFIMNAVQIRFQEGINTTVLEAGETRTYEKILKDILEQIEDKYIKEIEYADELTRKIMLAYKYGIDFREDISKLKNDRIAICRALDRTKENNRLLVRWMSICQNGKNLSGYFEQYGYREIAVYGVSDIGKLLIAALMGTGIQVRYGIDINADRVKVQIPVYKPEDKMPIVDAIVVTAVYFYDDICRQLRAGGIDIPIISLQEVMDFIE